MIPADMQYIEIIAILSLIPWFICLSLYYYFKFYSQFIRNRNLGNFVLILLDILFFNSIWVLDYLGMQTPPDKVSAVFWVAGVLSNYVLFDAEAHRKWMENVR